MQGTDASLCNSMQCLAESQNQSFGVCAWSQRRTVFRSSPAAVEALTGGFPASRRILPMIMSPISSVPVHRSCMSRLDASQEDTFKCLRGEESSTCDHTEHACEQHAAAAKRHALWSASQARAVFTWLRILSSAIRSSEAIRCMTHMMGCQWSRPFACAACANSASLMSIMFVSS